MKITICSRFRDASGHIERYCDQVAELSQALTRRGDHLQLIWGYGDSTDGTDEMLHDEATFFLDALLLDVSHGGPKFGSVEDPVRFRQRSEVANRLLACLPADADVVGWVESDLIWQASTLLALIDDLAHAPCVAPMVMDGPYSFYDVFAYRKDGRRFTKWPPYCEWLDGSNDLMQLDSAGSILFVRGDLARKARFSDGEEIVGFCQDITRHGGSIWLDPAQACQHPPYLSDGRHRGDAQRVPQHLRA